MDDPYRDFKFEVEIAGFLRAGFSKVSGLKQTTEVVEYREGADNETPRKLPGQTSFENVTLERGHSNDEDFINWSQTIFNLDRDNGEQGIGIGDDDNFRKDVVVYLKNKSGQRKVKWKVKKAWPMDHSTTDLDATANNVSIESLILANEGIKMTKL